MLLWGLVCWESLVTDTLGVKNIYKISIWYWYRQRSYRPITRADGKDRRQSLRQLSSGPTRLCVCGQTHSRQHRPSIATSWASRQCADDGGRSSCGHSEAQAYRPSWQVHSWLQFGLNSSPSLYVFPSTTHGLASRAVTWTSTNQDWFLI